MGLWACEKEGEQPAPPPPGSILPGQGLFVANEGNFGWGNASLSYYDKVNDTIMHELFYGANGVKLGDVLQSVYLHDGLAYLVVNNSGKIEVVEPGTGLGQGRIEGLLSPRYMEAVSGNRAYVTDLYAKQVSIIDLENQQVSGSIAMSGWTEAITTIHDRVYVSGMQSDQLYRIDPETDTLEDSLHVAPGPVAMVSDSKQMLWVLSGGSALFKDHPPTLYQVDPLGFSIAASYILPATDGFYSRLSVCPDGRYLYILGGDVLRLDTHSASPEAEVFIPAMGRLFYALAADPENGDVYVCDAIDYVQRGLLLRHNSQGELLNSQPTGIIPGHIAFY